jgi:hypothetical protein
MNYFAPLCLRGIFGSGLSGLCKFQNKKPGTAEMVSQVRAYEYLLLINDIHGPRGAFHDDKPDSFRSLCNGG